MEWLNSRHKFDNKEKNININQNEQIEKANLHFALYQNK